MGKCSRDCAQYASETLILGRRVEIIPVLDAAIEKLLLEYQKRNRKLPGTIVFYRDGIANNQFEECKAIEIPQIYKVGFVHIFLAQLLFICKVNLGVAHQ